MLPLLLASVALAGPLEDRLDAAREALLAADYDTAEDELDDAVKALDDATEVVDTATLARLYFYQGAVDNLGHGKMDDAMESWRQSLAFDVEYQWEEGILTYETGLDMYEALRREMADRTPVDPLLPEKTGLAKLYVDGRQVRHPDTVSEGSHLAQIECPDGGVHSVWITKLKKLQKLKWFKMCPGGVDTSVEVVEEVEEDEWGGHAPLFGPVEGDALVEDMGGDVLPDEEPVAEEPPEPVADEPDAPLEGPLTRQAFPAPEGETCPATANRLRVEADYAIDRYRRADGKAFMLHARGVAEGVGCLGEIVTPATAARVHMVQGLLHWSLGEEEPAASAFHGFVALRPDYEPPANLVPSGSGEGALLEQARVKGEGARKPLQSGTVIVDGSTGQDSVPVERAALVQRVGEDEAVTTWYLWGGEQLGEDLLGPVVIEPEPVPVVEVETVQKERRRRPSRWMAITGGSAVAIGGVALGYAAYTRAAYLETETDEMADQAYQYNQISGYSGYGLTAVGLGLGVGAVIVGKW